MAKIIWILMIVSYLIIINIISMIDLNLTWIQNFEQLETREITVGVSDSVSVIATKHRFYGKIIERNGDKILYLFYLIRVPIKVKSFDYTFIHIFFIIFFVFLLLRSQENKMRQ